MVGHNKNGLLPRQTFTGVTTLRGCCQTTTPAKIA